MSSRTSDGTPHFDLSNALVSVSRTSGTFRYSATFGAYAFPVVGQPFASTLGPGSSTGLYGPVPIAYLSFALGDALTISAGKLPTLLGQENEFTFQNGTIQRGLAWNAEPVVSRGVRAAYARGNVSADLEINDGYYSGRRLAVEGLVGYAPSSATSIQLAFIIANAGTTGNATAAVANKVEYDLMLSQTFGKLQIQPYLLFMASPASASAGFAASESASAQVMLATYAFDPRFSIASRYELVRNHSGVTDASVNADFVGYGPGSTARTFTITLAVRSGRLMLRGEYSTTAASAPATFGQQRFGFEILNQF